MGSTKKKIVLAMTEGRCWYCGKVLDMSFEPPLGHKVADWFVVDHVTPRSKGGSNDIGNLVAACWSCNSQKCDKNLEQYRLHIAMRATGAPYFTAKQLAWLAEQGFVVPTGEGVVFWAENQIEEVRS